MGYSLSQNAYICVEPKSWRTYHSQHVILHEDTFPFENLNPKTLEQSSPSSSDPKQTLISLSKLNMASLQAQDSPTVGTKSTTTPAIGSSHAPNSIPVSASSSSPLISLQIFQIEMHESVIPSNTEVRTHNLTTRSMSHIYKPKKSFLVTKFAIPPSLEPMSVIEALSDSRWCDTMSFELTALMRHDT